jgi:hypothetical protein
MEILPLYPQYVFSLLVYVVNNKHLFTRISEVHNHDTRSANNFHLPITNLTKYQKGFLLDSLFYSIDEYFNANNDIYS